jgi:CheY-like chemotaxis protein
MVGMVKTILVVDDSPLVTEMIKKVLDDSGYHSEVAYDGMEALEKIKAKTPDLILLDIEMPKMDGWTMLKELRFKVRLPKKVPVIMLTSKGKLEDLSILEGADAFLEKTPENLKNLPQKVAEYLKLAE